MTDAPLPAGSVHGRLGTTARMTDKGFTVDLRPTPFVLHHGLVRASVVALVVDIVAGLGIDDDPDAWALTTDLSVHLPAVPAPQSITGTSTTVRRGRRTAACVVDLVADDRSLGHGVAGFARVPRRPEDPPKPLFTPQTAVERFGSQGVLSAPLRDEAGLQVVDAAAGIVELAVTPQLVNPNGTLQGAMVALAVESAAEELVAARYGVAAVVTDLDLRYLARIESGSVQTRCRMVGDAPGAVIAVEVVDTTLGRVTTLAYARASLVDS